MTIISSQSISGTHSIISIFRKEKQLVQYTFTSWMLVGTHYDRPSLHPISAIKGHEYRSSLHSDSWWRGNKHWALKIGVMAAGPWETMTLIEHVVYELDSVCNINQIQFDIFISNKPSYLTHVERKLYYLLPIWALVRTSKILELITAKLPSHD